ncbi:hypothetical protein ES288_D01G128900v1 [Gossypium darwinii]|uniref:Uncharacterized protein n=2 Tax=Gossypium TaxID=3633 RepID=A0A5D2M8B4_GOSTO|nr:hypothetical protein ES288_D01G128900v1 [Gossypium darwinii]TYH87578.1 hypothetical protein ES332_D01G126400v1 [Gossypium tomentosum]
MNCLLPLRKPHGFMNVCKGKRCRIWRILKLMLIVWGSS